MKYATHNSLYEVDVEAQKVRRLAGLHAPTQRQGPDGEWKSYESLTVLSDRRLLIQWEGARCTVTSPAREVP